MVEQNVSFSSSEFSDNSLDGVIEQKQRKIADGKA